jgi:endonuclease YncB( thermonuclease family)
VTWRYKAYESEQPAIDSKAYVDDENEAKAARLGLWADFEPVPPWEFNHQGK